VSLHRDASAAEPKIAAAPGSTRAPRHAEFNAQSEHPPVAPSLQRVRPGPILPEKQRSKRHAMNSTSDILGLIIEIAFWVILAQAILSWLLHFGIVSPRQEIVGRIWYGLERVTEPVYRPIRRFLPDLGGIDLSPMVVIIGLLILRNLLGV